MTRTNRIATLASLIAAGAMFVSSGAIAQTVPFAGDGFGTAPTASVNGRKAKKLRKGKRANKAKRGVWKGLGLTDAQKATMKAIRTETKTAIQGLKGEIKALRGRLATLWSAATPDREAILAAHDQVAAVKADITTVKVDSRISVLSVLTREQRATLATARAAAKEAKANRRATRKAKKAAKANRGNKANKVSKRGKRGKRGKANRAG